jgi:hypothetical protein
MTTLTIMRQLPREVDPLVYKMSHEDPGNISYAEVGGLAEQIRELREVFFPFFKALVVNFQGGRTSSLESRIIQTCWNHAT